ncbi:MAG: hypothetical protein C4562_03715 [Actinobacteria bacterium]|nr:MAG: hypothetical protein C4562_03715 [Actinomycetota bacterium]
MRSTICIPTYWTAESGIPSQVKLHNIYDHPTPFNEEGTLGRCLESLTSVEGDFNVAIIATMTEPDLRKPLEDKLLKLLANYPSLNLYLFTHSNEAKIQQILEGKGMAFQKKYVSLEGYSNIRNLCLIIPRLLDSDLAILVDDDEVVKQVDFIKRCQYKMNKDFDNEVVLGKTGYYINEKGEHLGSDIVPWWDFFWQKGKAMNAVLKTIKEPPRLKKTPLALGGAMVIHKDLFEKVSFDPWILRGEDIDYLINAKLLGNNFYLDNEIALTHVPPEHMGHTMGMKQDYYRFIYEREKLKRAFRRPDDFKQFPLEELDPYPGYFLKKSIIPKSFSLASLTTLRDCYHKDVGGHINNIGHVLFSALRYAKKNGDNWFRFQNGWPSFMSVIKEEEFGKVVTKI